LATKYTTGSFEIAQFYPEAAPEMNVILASACGLLTFDSSGKVRLMREWLHVQILHPSHN